MATAVADDDQRVGPPHFDLSEFVRRVLAEDMGSGGDVTSNATIAVDARFKAEMRCREPITVAGLDIAIAFFRALDREVRVQKAVGDGDKVDAGKVLMRLEGNARAMLTATLTRRYVDAIAGTAAVLLDTRKTVPGMRLLDKFAARMGGARNHRMRLDDGILIKDNHVAVCGSVGDCVRAAVKAKTGLEVQAEIDRLDQIEPAIQAGADRLLLDNMQPDMLREAVKIVAKRVPVEASGGVTLETVRAIAESGVDYISVGRITQSAPAVDIGLDYALQELPG
jgi:nicotinate-nucleotide pyrophosphorylase (carboxylating)